MKEGLHYIPINLENETEKKEVLAKKWEMFCKGAIMYLCTRWFCEYRFFNFFFVTLFRLGFLSIAYLVVDNLARLGIMVC